MENNCSTILNTLLPKLQKNKKVVCGAGFMFVHSPGFEERTLGFKNAISFSSGSMAILLNYIPHNSDNKMGPVRDYLLSNNVLLEDKDIIDYNRFCPGDFETQLQQRIEEKKVNSVIVDISSMSKLQIMLVLNACNKAKLETKILYCEADSYRPTYEEFEICKQLDKIHQPTLQIFTGVYGVVRAESLASVAMQGQPTASIIFMSFNDILTQAILNSVYPGRLFLVNSSPPVHKWREEATAWIHERLRREWQEDNPTYWHEKLKKTLPRRSVSTLYYNETVDLLLNLYWELSADHRILLTPSGSKLQTVGCYLIKVLHPDVHIEYSSPQGFAFGYSAGVGPWWILEIGDISKLRENISAMEREIFLEI